MIATCETFGQRTYERLRANAIVLTLRYTALRIGDVSMLENNRSKDGDRWRIFIRPEKSGQPVFLPLPPDLEAALDCVPSPNPESGIAIFFLERNLEAENTEGAH